jgi:acyl dehydratase
MTRIAAPMVGGMVTAPLLSMLVIPAAWYSAAVLKHGDIPNIAMPAMTMGFDVADKKMLDPVKAGDKVRFHVEVIQGKPTVTHLEAVR